MRLILNKLISTDLFKGSYFRAEVIIQFESSAYHSADYAHKEHGQ